jgi:IS5 family transposase
MSHVDDLLLHVYCFLDDLLPEVLRQWGVLRLRRCGTSPALSDAEALTVMIVGEWLGCANDAALYRQAHLHWQSAFPTLPHRTSFTRQIANLWQVIQGLWQHLLTLSGALLGNLYIADSFPLVSCGWTRAPLRRRFRAEGSNGYCASKKMRYFGLKAHLLVHQTGLIVGMALTPANANDREILDGLAGHGGCAVLADKNYLCGWWQQHMQEGRGITVITGKRKNMRTSNTPQERSLLRNCRKIVETVVGQLEGRFGLARVWPRDLWHLHAALIRKVLAHTLGCHLNLQAGRPPLQLAELLPA